MDKIKNIPYFYKKIMAGKKGMQGGGRKQRFGEETTVIRKRVPLSKAEEISAKFDKIIERYAKKKQPPASRS